jgi:hypothetical protein
LSFLAKCAAPINAIIRKTDNTSNGSRYLVILSIPMVCVVLSLSNIGADDLIQFNPEKSICKFKLTKINKNVRQINIPVS